MADILTHTKPEALDAKAANAPNYSAIELLAMGPKTSTTTTAGGRDRSEAQSLEMTPLFPAKDGATRDRDPEKAFSLGVKGYSQEQIYKKWPELNATINDITEDSVNPPNAQYKGMDKPESVESYKVKAFGQMLEKYGPERVKEMLDTLAKTSQAGKIQDFRFDLTYQGNSPEGLNKRLHNMADLCEPGGLERLRQLSDKMKAEGYTKNMSLSMMTPKNIDLLLNKPEERKATIAFENLTRTTMAPIKFLSDNPEYGDKGNKLPTERLKAYEQWKKTH